MTFDISRYRHGYSIGAGAVVLCGEKILLVRLSYGSSQRQWSLPGGYVEPEETIDVTIKREVLEETGVSADVEGLLAARSRVLAHENSLYLVFLLRAATEETRPDGVEVREACFFPLEEAQALPDLTPMTHLIVARVAQGDLRLLQPIQVPPYATSEFVLFL
jgi:ADP-ribose pyrophosphatase YjhB (NUDIX family)